MTSFFFFLINWWIQHRIKFCIVRQMTNIVCRRIWLTFVYQVWTWVTYIKGPLFFFPQMSRVANDHLAFEIPKLTTLSLGCGHMAKSELALPRMPTFSSWVSFSSSLPPTLSVQWGLIPKGWVGGSRRSVRKQPLSAITLLEYSGTVLGVMHWVLTPPCTQDFIIL